MANYKYSVLRKDLISGEISYGNIDIDIEAQNLIGNIDPEHPYIEITQSDPGFIEWNNKHLLSIAKFKKERDITEYWGDAGNLRKFKIMKNGAELPSIANEQFFLDLQNNITNLTDYAEDQNIDPKTLIWNYRYAVGIIIPVTYSQLKRINIRVTDRRNKCASSKKEHAKIMNALEVFVIENGQPTTQIDYPATIEAVENYDFSKDPFTDQLLEPMADIVL